ncbi:hypothetical protein EON66_01075 [archaeon]|nr:MAG: hypothetical protein EON66_01075 [archaeon]
MDRLLEEHLAIIDVTPGTHHPTPTASCSRTASCLHSDQKIACTWSVRACAEEFADVCMKSAPGSAVRSLAIENILAVDDFLTFKKVCASIAPRWSPLQLSKGVHHPVRGSVARLPRALADDDSTQC